MGADLGRGGTTRIGPGDTRLTSMSPSPIDVQSNPAGASTYLFRFEKLRGRLLPVPCNAKGIISDAPTGGIGALAWDAGDEEKKRVRDGTANPLTCSSFNDVKFPFVLRPGSYLVVFRMQGFADARVSVFLPGTAKFQATVELLRPGEIPPGFVYVPAGGFIAANDPLAEDYTGEGRAKKAGLRPVVPGFLIARFSVTSGEYLDFLNDKLWHAGKKDPQARAPRSAPEGEYAWMGSGGKFALGDWSADEPAAGISHDDATEFARWATARRGVGKWIFRLPTEDEWEKAARGTDGRLFPWGDQPNPAFSAMMDSREVGTAGRTSPMERIGLFPADESPYGVRDMAGVIRNWTKSQTADSANFIVKGGAWSGSAQWCRAAGRVASPPTAVNAGGLRLAAPLHAAVPMSVDDF